MSPGQKKTGARKTASKKAVAAKTVSKKATPKARPLTPGEIPIWRSRKFEEPALDLPTVADLANLAATIASPTEEPEIAAKRAMDLWLACDQRLLDTMRALWETEFELNSELANGEQQKMWKVFLADCGIDPDDILGSKAKNVVVPFHDFLNACKVNDKKSPEEFLKRWKEFRNQEIRGSGRTSGDFFAPKFWGDGIRSFEISSASETGIPAIFLRDCWHSCSRYIEHDRISQGVSHGQMMARAKKLHALSKAVIGGNSLSKEESDLLKTVSDEEQFAEIEYHSMARKLAAKWEAAVCDAKAPENARPRKCKSTEKK